MIYLYVISVIVANEQQKKISCTSVGTVDKKVDKKVNCRLI